jgi:hypothetical protein
MTNLLICLAFLLGSFAITVYLTRRGIKGLRDKKMIADRAGNFATGKDAVSIAKIYLFLAALCLVLTIMFLIGAIALIVRIW